MDLLEANSGAMQAAIHTETGGSYGSGNCDRNGCFARVGGPQAPFEKRDAFGVGKTIDTRRSFDVEATVDVEGALRIQLRQGANVVTSFDRSMAGNPAGSGIPQAALQATRASQGKLAFVASLWQSDDLSWLDRPGCNKQ